VVYGKTRFAKGGMEFVNQYQEYIEFPKYKERFLLEPAPISVHNLIIGTPYLDVGGRAYMRNLKCPKEQYVEITFQKRNWSGDNNFRVNASVFSAPGKVAYKIEGRWNDEVSLIDPNTGKKEYTWKKPPYPENSEYMYGMTHHHLQFNNITPELAKSIAPTDCRLRPDQRALENGDFKLAAAEKNRLEEKQRSIRRYNEKHNITPTPYYFDIYDNQNDPSQVYYKYNGKYFENDRPKKDWSRLPDLFSETLPPEVEAFESQKKKK